MYIHVLFYEINMDSSDSKNLCEAGSDFYISTVN